MTLNQPEKNSLAEAGADSLLNLFKVLNTSEELRTKVANLLESDGKNSPQDCIDYLESLKKLLDCMIETLDLKVGT